MPEVLEIMMEGAPVLRQIAMCVPINSINVLEVQGFIDDMLETCFKTGAVGLAAPQVNKSLQIAVIVSRPTVAYPNAPVVEPFVVINPVITDRSGQVELGWEGCMSVKNERGHPRAKVERSTWVIIEFYDRQAKKQTMRLEGFPARVLQHEFDHLWGIMFTDLIDRSNLVEEDDFLEKLKTGTLK